MPQLFSPRANGLVRLLIAVVLLGVVVGVVVLYGLTFSPYATGQNRVPRQPVPFSHQHHVGALGIECGYCHTSFDRSPFAGMPDTATCMSCHSQLWTSADMLAPVRESLKTSRPLAWVRVHDLPDFVYFNHQAHVNNGVGCESCHGRVDRMPLMRQARPLTMQWCLDCHRDPGPQLREGDRITAMGHTPEGPGDEFIQEYDITTDRLTECVTCHR
ncbi:MAG: cytochrome c3 family protein [Marinobacter sp.]